MKYYAAEEEEGPATGSPIIPIGSAPPTDPSSSYQHPHPPHQPYPHHLRLPRRCPPTNSTPPERLPHLYPCQPTSRPPRRLPHPSPPHPTTSLAIGKRYPPWHSPSSTPPTGFQPSLHLPSSTQPIGRPTAPYTRQRFRRASVAILRPQASPHPVPEPRPASASSAFSCFSSSC